jgi:DNA invertase Pin-like site-specific DNA recombinase
VLKNVRFMSHCFRSHGGGSDESSDLVVALLASIAKLEREKKHEWTLAGLARARRQGRIGGRPRADEDAKLVASVQRVRDAGKSIREIASTLDKSPTTIQRLVKAEAA